MSKKLNALLSKREELEKQILEAQQFEKRKIRVQQIVLAALEKHPRAALADEQLLRETIQGAFSEIAQNLPSV